MAGPRYNRALVIVFVLVVIAGLALVALLRRGQSVGERYDPRESTMLSGIHGAKAYYLLLDELGFSVRRRFERFTWTPEAYADTVVHALLAPAVPLLPYEESFLLRSIEQGDGLLLVAELAGERLAAELGLRRGFVVDSFFPPVAAGPAWTPREVSAAAAYFVPDDEAPELEILLGHEDRPVAVTFRYGGGRVVAFADGRYFTNRYLRSAGNAVLVVNLVPAFWEGRPLVFDEFHHGFQKGGRVPERVAGFLVGHPLGWALLQLALAGLVLLYLRGRRMGAPRPPRPPRRRSEIEHVEALAGAYEGAGAYRAAADLLIAGLQRRLGLRMGPVHAREAVFWSRLARWLEDPAQRDAVERLRTLSRGEIQEHELVEIGRMIHEIEGEVHRRWTSGGRRSSGARR